MSIHAAVVGLGYWGPNLLRNLNETGACGELTACDLDSERLERIKRRYPGVRVTTDFERILDDGTIDAVLIATPISTHYALAKRVLEAGKHCFVEKPMAHNSSAALDLVRIAEARSRTLMVGHTFEYSPPVIKIKEIISSGELGELFYISSSRVNLGLHQKDVSVIWDLAPHDFSVLFHWLNQDPVRIIAVGKDYVQRGIPDVAFITLEFESGTIANVHVSWLAPSKLRRTAVVGSRKMLVYDDTESIEKVKIFDKGVEYKDPETFGEYQLSYRAGDIVSPKLGNYEPLAVEMAHFMDCIETGEKPKSDGVSGLRVVRALEAAERSIKNGGEKQEMRNEAHD